MEREADEYRDRLDNAAQAEYVIELLFNICASLCEIEPHSPESDKLWQELMSIKEAAPQIPDLFLQLEQYAIDFMSGRPSEHS